jgi:hypothetical protein
MATIKPRPSRRQLGKRLALLLGTWSLEMIPADPNTPHFRGMTSFRWLVKDAILVMRSRVRGGPPKPPNSVSAIGADDSNNTYTMLYSDERPVIRHYAMTLTRRVWTLERRAPGFSQRFIGRFADNRRTIKGASEKSADGRRWEHDFTMIYRKKR